MLYIVIGNAIMLLLSTIDDSGTAYRLLRFDRALILQGQLWRLITFPLCYTSTSPLWSVVMLYFYYTFGRAIENIWGTLRFNLFYLSGIILMDVFCMVFGGSASAYYLNLSLALAYATLYPDSRFLILYIIPVKAWVLALLYFAMILFTLFGSSFPYNLFPLVALANYFLFFGRDVLRVVPVSWQANARRAARRATQKKTAKTIPFNSAGSYEATHAKPQAPYTHRCTVCGRTDVSDPKLEFRYCSKCKGYYCYCEEHISNHAHIE